MNNKSFLQGFLYGLIYAESLEISIQTLWARGHKVLIWFKDGSRICFGVNRGIDHIYGNFVAMTTEKESCNLFDIYDGWLTPAQSKIINTNEKYKAQLDDSSEIRLTFDELVEVIDSLGEIDYSVTQQEWLKIFLTKYYKK